jgi:hypothetical protein
MQARLMLHPTAFKCRNTTNLFANAHADKGSADEKSIRGRVPRFVTSRSQIGLEPEGRWLTTGFSAAAN